MRNKATNKKAASSAVHTFPAKDCAGLKVTTQTTSTGGKGLGKAGARRLGQLLKQLTQKQEATAEEKASLPKTPVRLFKHWIQTAAENLPRTHTATPYLPQVPHLLLGVVSQCKLQGSISMAELRQMLAAGGLDVTQNNCQVNQGLLKKQTTRSSSPSLNNMIHTKQVWMSNVESPNSKTNLRQRARVCMSSKGAETSQRQAIRTPISKWKTLREVTKKHKLTPNTRKAAAKSRKSTRKTPQPKGKKSRSSTKQAARIQKVRRTKRRPSQTLRRRQQDAGRDRKKQRRGRRKAGYY